MLSKCRLHAIVIAIADADGVVVVVVCCHYCCLLVVCRMSFAIVCLFL